MTLGDALRTNLLDSSTGLVTDPISGQQMSLVEAVTAGIIDAEASSIVDPSSGKTMSLTEGLRFGIVDGMSGKVVDRTTGRMLDLDEAVKPVTCISSTGEDDAAVSKSRITLDDALRANLLDSSTGLVTYPISGRQMTLEEAVRAGVIDAEASSIVDPSSGKTMSLSEGLRFGIVDGKCGKVVDCTTGRTIGLDECISPESNISLTVDKVSFKCRPLDLKSAIEADIFDSVTGAVSDPETGIFKSLADGIRDGLIDPLDTILLDPLTGTACTLQDAMDNGTVLPDTGMVYDKTSGKLMTFADAMKSGVLVLEQKSAKDQDLISLEDAISSGLFDSRTGTFLDSSTNERVPFREALGKIVDVSGIGVRHPETNRMLSLEEAISDGLVNAETGYFNTATGSPISLQQAMMLGYVMGWMARELTIDSTPANTNKSLQDLMQNGLLDADTGLVYDSAAGEKISIEDAVSRGIIDGKTLSTYDAGSGKMLSIEECICRGLINSATGRVTDPSSGEERSIVDIVAASQVVDSRTAKPVTPERVKEHLYVSSDSSAALVTEAELRKSNANRNEAVTGLLESGRDTDVEAVEVTDVQQSGLTQGATESRHLGASSLDAAAAPATKDLSRHTAIAETSQLEVKPAAGHIDVSCC